MLRVALLLLTSSLMLLGWLNVVRTPAWLPWRLGVLAGEYGHWLALLALMAGGGAWLGRAPPTVVTLATLATAVLAAVLLIRPVVVAWRLARTLPTQLAAGFPGMTRRGDAFALAPLWCGMNPPPVSVETLPGPGGLPIDFYAPGAIEDGRPAPCVVVVHGGGWNSGDRRQIPHFNHALAHRGYAVAAISYRLAPNFQWPAQREDLLAALHYLRTHAERLRIDPTRFVLLGRSAGGQVALTTAYTAVDPAIRGVIGLYAPSDLIFGYVNTHENDMLKSPSLMRQYLGGTPDSARANYESASAIFHVGRGTPPTLLLQGANDALVWHRHSVRLAARLAEQRIPHAHLELPWATHAFDYNLHGPGGQLTMYAVERFLAWATQ